ncbi:hypothetical protein L6452_09886 [Arctium lappa]|uniref:Uncharacterized protein n=1 Tax=Arctium lappa TaxID=4217 RepID=A0ACB9DL89_ARCLA|nr:hypothetical protein L6452_09886 [Arctium lappa]
MDLETVEAVNGEKQRRDEELKNESSEDENNVKKAKVGEDHHEVAGNYIGGGEVNAIKFCRSAVTGNGDDKVDYSIDEDVDYVFGLWNNNNWFDLRIGSNYILVIVVVRTNVCHGFWNGIEIIFQNGDRKSNEVEIRNTMDFVDFFDRLKIYAKSEALYWCFHGD